MNNTDFMMKLKQIEHHEACSKSEKIKLINHFFRDELPASASFEELHQLILELVRIEKLCIDQQIESLKLFNSNPLFPAMNYIMNQYIHQIKCDIEKDFLQKNIETLSDEGIEQYNRSFINALQIHENVFEMMFKVNQKSFLEIYAENRHLTDQELGSVVDYERALREAFDSGIDVGFFKK